MKNLLFDGKYDRLLVAKVDYLARRTKRTDELQKWRIEFHPSKQLVFQQQVYLYYTLYKKRAVGNFSLEALRGLDFALKEGIQIGSLLWTILLR
jgi:hypothetical protein